MMRCWMVGHVCVVALAAATPLLAQPNIPAGLTTNQRSIFCALDGHEASGAYSAAVLAELKRRELGGRSTKDALHDMRIEYCRGSSK